MTRHSASTQPIHTVYGGAHLFRADIASKCGAIAEHLLQRYAPNPEKFALAVGVDPKVPWLEQVYNRACTKLKNEPVEDYRIDFEDGYGYRPDDEKDTHIQQCAREVARGTKEGILPPFLGIRVEPFQPETKERARHTLDFFFNTLADQEPDLSSIPFVITLPKVLTSQSVSSLSEEIHKVEQQCGLNEETIGIELMIEHPRAIISEDGSCALPALIQAAGNRCRAVHFGAYDYTAACEISALSQGLGHPSCDFARHMMQAALAGSGVHLSDGATTLLPIEPHRTANTDEELTTEQMKENLNSIYRAWRESYRDIRRSLHQGFYQGWDLHPGQIPIRYFTVFSYFHEGLELAAQRFRRFQEQAAQATRSGCHFDDVATGYGLFNFFQRAWACGAIDEHQLESGGLTRLDVEAGTFQDLIHKLIEPA